MELSKEKTSTIKIFKNKLKADNLTPEVKKALEVKIKMLEGGKTVLK